MPLEDVVDFINEFVKANAIPHFYMGSIASSIHGRARSTEDADLVLLSAPADVGAILDGIEAAGLSLGDRKGIVRQKLESGLPAKIAWDEIYSFDLRLASYSIDDEALNRAVIQKDLSGRELRVAPPEEIIVYKLARFIRRDKGDIKGILRAQESLDWPRIERLAQQLTTERNDPKILANLKIIKGWL